MGFDVEGARKAGYSEPEIMDHLAKQSNFDIAGAKKAGYNDAEILQHLSTAASAPESRGVAGEAPAAAPERPRGRRRTPDPGLRAGRSARWTAGLPLCGRCRPGGGGRVH